MGSFKKSDLIREPARDPLMAGGLEYLFGFVDVHRAAPRFTPFWGHDREQEKRAFEAAMDFITARMAASPDAHVYHYAAYEETALKRLAMVHGTRETALDNLLRQGKLIDLYRVVREAVRSRSDGRHVIQRGAPSCFRDPTRGSFTCFMGQSTPETAGPSTLPGRPRACRVEGSRRSAPGVAPTS